MHCSPGKRGHFIEHSRAQNARQEMSSEGMQEYYKRSGKIEIKDARQNVSFGSDVLRAHLFRCGCSLPKERQSIPKDLLRMLRRSSFARWRKGRYHEGRIGLDIRLCRLTGTIRFYMFDRRPLRAWFDSVFKKLAPGKEDYTLPMPCATQLYDGSKLWDAVSRSIRHLHLKTAG